MGEPVDREKLVQLRSLCSGLGAAGVGEQLKPRSEVVNFGNTVFQTKSKKQSFLKLLHREPKGKRLCVLSIPMGLHATVSAYRA